MHILLTDRLSCPRCGPDFGLILLAEHIQDRRVLEGEIGCPNCRERFLIGDGFADLMWPPQPDVADRQKAKLGSTDPESALRVAAMLAITGGPGHVLLLGTSVRHATILADLVDDIEWIAADPLAEQLPERVGVSRIGVSAEGLPFFRAAFRGAVLEGVTGSVLRDVPRVLMPGVRVVCLRPVKGAVDALREVGFTVVSNDEDAIVATSPRGGSGVASPPPPN